MKEIEPESLDKILNGISLEFGTPEEIAPLKAKIEARFNYLQSKDSGKYKNGKVVIDLNRIKEYNQCYQILQNFDSMLTMAELRKRRNK